MRGDLFIFILLAAEVRENNSDRQATMRYCNICRESQAFPLKSQLPDGFDKISLLS